MTRVMVPAKIISAAAVIHYSQDGCASSYPRRDNKRNNNNAKKNITIYTYHKLNCRF